jgi:hypothetical protein
MSLIYDWARQQHIIPLHYNDLFFKKYTNNQSLIFSWLAQFNEFELHLMLSHKAKREAKTVSLRSWWFATV